MGQPSPAVSTRSSTWSNENKLNSLSSLTTSIQSKLLSTFQLFAERWMSHTASLKAKPDLDNSSAENNAPVLLSKTSKPNTSLTWLSSSKPSEPTTTNDPTKSENTGAVELWEPNLKPNSTNDSDWKLWPETKKPPLKSKFDRIVAQLFQKT